MKNKTLKLMKDVEKAYDETWKAVEATPEYEAYLKAQKATTEAWEAVYATPAWKAYKEAEKAMKATPGYKEYREIWRD